MYAPTSGGGKSIVLLDVASVLQDRHTRGEPATHLITSTTIYSPDRTGVVLSAVIDSGSPFNLISQLQVKQLHLQNGVTPSRKPRGIDGKPLQTYLEYTVDVFTSDSAGRIAKTNCIVLGADIGGFDMILGRPWLKAASPSIDWEKDYWTHHQDHDITWTANIALLNAGEFEAECLTEGARAFVLAISDIVDSSILSTPPITIPSEYLDLAEVFSEEAANTLPEHGPQDLALETSGTPPFGPLYNLSQVELEVLREYISDNLAKGFIQPSTSSAGAPVLFIKKGDDSLRLCVDYRGLNLITQKNRYPLPLISEALDRVVGAKIYTKLDIRAAYNRIRVRAGDEWKTAFRSRYGHYEYRVMPFGVVNGPATFQGYINSVLREYLDRLCIAYLDDILIYSVDPAQHTNDVRAVLKRLLKHGLFVKLEKCVFRVKEISFLGFLLTTEGVKMEPSRVSTIAEWPEPTTFREIQVFLGFANFYRRFILGFSRIVGGLTDMLKGGTQGKFKGVPFTFTPEARTSFLNLRTAFTTAPLLRHFDPLLPIRMESDASGFAISAILSQAHPETGHWHPVAFWSRKKSPAERNYGIGESEMLAIVEACKEWRHYVEGATHQVVVITDHANLQRFLVDKQLNRREARWWERLSGLDLSIQYRPGKLNPADAPSRRPDYEPEDLVLAMENVDPAGGSKSVLITQKYTSEVAALQKLNQQTLLHQPIQLEFEGPWNFVLLGTVGEDGFVIPRSELRAATDQESAYEETSLTMQTAIRALQEVDPLAKRRRTALSRSKSVLIGVSDAGTASVGSHSFQKHEVSIDSDSPLSSLPSGPEMSDPEKEYWRLQEGLLLFRGRLYVPPGLLRREVVRLNHDDPLAGHFGFARTLALIQRKYYWPGMNKDIKSYVDTCDTCHRIKPVRHKPYGELSALPPPRAPFTDLTMDFITDMPPSEFHGIVYDSIFIVMCRYTKLARYIPARMDWTAERLAEAFIENVWREKGLPDSVVSDRGSLFTSKFWSAMCFHLKIKQRLSSAFHPQTDGQTERQNQTLEQYLRGYANYQQDDWVSWLAIAEFAYNNSVHSATGQSPFFLAYGLHPVMPDSLQLSKDVNIPVARDRAQNLVQLRAELEKRWAEFSIGKEKYYNAKHEPKSYRVGDKVWLSGRNIRTTRPAKKLDYKYHGPFVISKCIGTQAYQLDLPEALQNIHDVFHVSLLEPYHTVEGRAPPPPPLIEVDGEEQAEIEEILDSRMHYGKLQYLVKWLGYSVSDNEWIWAGNLGAAEEYVAEFHQKYPLKPSPGNLHREKRHRRGKNKK